MTPLAWQDTGHFLASLILLTTFAFFGAAAYDSIGLRSRFAAESRLADHEIGSSAYLTADADADRRAAEQRCAQIESDARENRELGADERYVAVSPTLGQFDQQEVNKRAEALRLEGMEDAAKICDEIGVDWRDAGDMTKFYATNYLIERIRAEIERRKAK